MSAKHISESSILSSPSTPKKRIRKSEKGRIRKPRQRFKSKEERKIYVAQWKEKQKEKQAKLKKDWYERMEDLELLYLYQSDINVRGVKRV